MAPTHKKWQKLFVNGVGVHNPASLTAFSWVGDRPAKVLQTSTDTISGHT